VESKTFNRQPSDNQSFIEVMSHRFTTTLEEDDFGDLILNIPYEVCEELGWDVGTLLDYDITEDGTSFTLRKSNDQ
jgi:hypothetical protein